MNYEIKNLFLRDVDAFQDFYYSYLETNPSLSPPFITITMINYGSYMFMARNTACKHSEINCWELFQSKVKKTRKNMNIYITEVRCRLINGKFEYSMSQPCIHCTKKFKHFAKYYISQSNTSIYFRWSINSLHEPLITEFKDVREITNSTISTGWALKHGRM